MKIHRGYSRRGLSALIAAGLALGSASAYAETITEDNHTVTVTDERTHVYGARILVHEARDGSADYRANTNKVNITAQGVQTGDLYGVFIEQRAALTGSNFTAEANGNRIINQGGAIKHATAAWVSLTASDATSLSVTVDDNDVNGTGGAYSYVFGGGFGSIAANSGAVKTIVTNNDITIENGTLKDGFSAGGGYARAATRNGTAEAHADKNTVTLRNSSSTNGGYSGGTAYAFPSGARATATANENVVAITGGTYSNGRNVTGGSATVLNGTDTILATANANRVTLRSDGHSIWESITGGSATAETTEGAATATTNGNIVTLAAGNFVKTEIAEGVTTETNIYGGYANAKARNGAAAIAENNEVHIGGGTYDTPIYAARAVTDGTANTTATVRNNILEISGTPDLSRIGLFGGSAQAAHVTREGNALIVRETKGITAASIADFQRLAFYVPAGMTADDTMLRVTSSANTNLSGTALEAYLPGSSTANRLRLLYTENAQIDTDGATTMTVYEGVSGHRTPSTGAQRRRRIPTQTPIRTRIPIRIRIPTQTRIRTPIPTRTPIQTQTQIRIRTLTRIPTRIPTRTQIQAITTSFCTRTRSPSPKP